MSLNGDRRGGPFGDPAATPRFPDPHTADRKPPIYSDGPAGPWRGRVTVTPVRVRRGYVFEVLAEWGGPGLLVPGLGDGQRQVAHAEDTAVVNTAEQGRALAIHAQDLLTAGRRPEPTLHSNGRGLAALAAVQLGPDALYRT